MLHGRASDRSIYLRFFSASRTNADDYVGKLTRPSAKDHHAIAAACTGRLQVSHRLSVSTKTKPR